MFMDVVIHYIIVMPLFLKYHLKDSYKWNKDLTCTNFLMEVSVLLYAHIAI